MTTTVTSSGEVLSVGIRYRRASRRVRPRVAPEGPCEAREAHWLRVLVHRLERLILTRLRRLLEREGVVEILQVVLVLEPEQLRQDRIPGTGVILPGANGIPGVKLVVLVLDRSI